MSIREYLISFIDAVLVAYIVSVFIGKVPRHNRWRLIPAIPLVAYCSAWVYYNAPFTAPGIAFRTITPFVLTALLVYATYGSGFRLAAVMAVVSVLTYLLLQMVTVLVANPLSQLLSRNTNLLTEQEALQLLIMCLSWLILFLARKKLRLFGDDIAFFVNRLTGAKMLKGLLYSLSVSCGIFLALSVFFAGDYLKLVITVLFLTSALLLVSMKVTDNIRDMNRKEDMDMQRFYMANYRNILEDVKGFWHSYANIMQVLMIVVNGEKEIKSDDLKKLLQQFTDWEQVNNVGKKIRIINIPHVALAGLLSSKLQKATELGVDLVITSSGEAEINMNMRDLLEIVGVITDNAIEAAHYAADKEVRIAIEMNEYIFSLEIDNRYLRENGKTMKYGKSSRVGLYRVRSIVEKHTQSYLEITDDDGKYNVVLEIKNDKVATA